MVSVRDFGREGWDSEYFQKRCNVALIFGDETFEWGIKMHLKSPLRDEEKVSYAALCSAKHIAFGSMMEWTPL